MYVFPGSRILRRFFNGPDTVAHTPAPARSTRAAAGSARNDRPAPDDPRGDASAPAQLAAAHHCHWDKLRPRASRALVIGPLRCSCAAATTIQFHAADMRRPAFLFIYAPFDAPDVG